jgi:hypothetical protein
MILVRPTQLDFEIRATPRTDFWRNREGQVGVFGVFWADPLTRLAPRPTDFGQFQGQGQDPKHGSARGAGAIRASSTSAFLGRRGEEGVSFPISTRRLVAALVFTQKRVGVSVSLFGLAPCRAPTQRPPCLAGRDTRGRQWLPRARSCRFPLCPGIPRYNQPS